MRDAGCVSHRGRGADGVAHFLDGAAELSLVEERRAADKRICAGPGALDGGVIVDAAVHFDAVAEISLATPGGGLLDFWNDLVDERLAAQAGIDRHDRSE